MLTETNLNIYNVWTTYFTKDLLIKEMAEAGFKVVEVFGDLLGQEYSEKSETIAILVEKQ